LRLDASSNSEWRIESCRHGVRPRRPAEADGLDVDLGILSLRRDGPVSRLVLSILLFATAIAVGAMCWTGNLGGKIRHSELRATAPITTGDHENAAARSALTGAMSSVASS
jgi:hypothetical protein